MSDIDSVVSYLRNAQPGRQPLEIFIELARLVVLPTLEIIPLRKKPETGITEVLMTQRPATDPWWPNLWHNPGTVLLATDPLQDKHDYSEPEKRVFEGELQSAVTVVRGPFEIDIERRNCIRGQEIAVICWAEVSGEPVVGEYFALDELPTDLVEHQVPSFLVAAAAFEQT